MKQNKKLLFGIILLISIFIIILNNSFVSAGSKTCQQFCVYSSDCVSGLTCTNNRCVNASCPTDLDCICPTCNQSCTTAAGCTGINEFCYSYSDLSADCNRDCGSWWGSCPEGMTCIGGNFYTAGKCRNSACQDNADCICKKCRSALCPNDEDCVCSFGCNSSCYSDSECTSGLKCYNAIPNSGIAGNCREPNCLTHDDCNCFKCQNDSNCNDNNPNTMDLCEQCFSCSWSSMVENYCYFPGLESDPGCRYPFMTKNPINSSCIYFPLTAERNNCFDGKDNDGDGKIDYKDEDCVNMQLKTMYINKVQDSPLYIDLTYQNLGNSKTIIKGVYPDYQMDLLIPSTQLNEQSCIYYGFGTSGWPRCSFNYTLNKCICPLPPASDSYQIYYPNNEINRSFEINIKNWQTNENLYLEGDYQIRTKYGACTSANKVFYSNLGEVWDYCILKEIRTIDFSLQRNCYFINGQNYCCGVLDGICPEDFEDFEGNQIECGESQDPDCYVAPIPCKITSASIIPNCGTDSVCNASVDKINMSITVENPDYCQNIINGGKMEFFVSSQHSPDVLYSSNNERKNPDLSFDSFQAGICSLNFFNTSRITRNGNTFNATWTVQIPQNCYGKTVTATTARLYNSSNTVIAQKSGNFGQFTFAQAPPTAEFSSLIVYPGESISLNRGKSEIFNVFGIYENGTVVNITDHSETSYEFETGANYFTVNRNIITAKSNAVAGIYDFNIGYRNLYKIVKVKVTEDKELSAIKLIPITTQNKTGEYVLYVANVTYSDGTYLYKTDDPNTYYNSSDKNIAEQQSPKNKFTAKNVGTAIIWANYTELGKTVYGFAIFNVYRTEGATFIGSYLDGPGAIKVNENQIYKHVLIWRDGSQIFEEDASLYGLTTFNSNDTNRARFTSPKNNLRGIAIGTINASSIYSYASNSVSNPWKYVTIVPEGTTSYPTEIILTPSLDTIEIEENWKHNIKVRYNNNPTPQPLPTGTTCTFAANPDGVVDINEQTITGRNSGITIITATCTVQNIPLQDSAILIVGGVITTECTRCSDGTSVNSCNPITNKKCERTGINCNLIDCPSGTSCNAQTRQCLGTAQTCIATQEQPCIDASCYWNLSSKCNACFSYLNKPTSCNDYPSQLSCSGDSCYVAPMLGYAAGADCSISENCKCDWEGNECKLKLITASGQTCTYTSTNIGECGIGCPPGQRKIDYISSISGCGRSECVSCVAGGTKPLPGFDFKNLIFVLLLIAGYYAYNGIKKVCLKGKCKN